VLVALLPIVWGISSSLKGRSELYKTMPSLLPKHPILDNYIWVIGQMGNVPQYFRNSAIVSFGTVAMVVLLASLAGYAFARRRFWGRELIFNVLLATLTIPGAVLMTPLFLIILKLGWINKFIGIIVPFSVSVTNIFLMRQYISTLPIELEESARIDGASDFTIWWRIILPLSKPAMTTVAIFSFVGAWDGFLWPLIVLKDKTMWTLNVALGLLQQEYIAAEGSPWGVMMAGSLLVVLPLIGVFLTLQRYFMSGLTIGAVKG